MHPLIADYSCCCCSNIAASQNVCVGVRQAHAASWLPSIHIVMNITLKAENKRHNLTAAQGAFNGIVFAYIAIMVSVNLSRVTSQGTRGWLACCSGLAATLLVCLPCTADCQSTLPYKCLDLHLHGRRPGCQLSSRMAPCLPVNQVNMLLLLGCRSGTLAAAKIWGKGK